MKKRVLSLIAMLLAFLLLTACGGNDEKKSEGEIIGRPGILDITKSGSENPAITMIECDACGGSGQNCDKCTDGICYSCKGVGEKACTICDGTGKCGLCMGSGKGTSGRTCYACYGSGACNGS